MFRRKIGLVALAAGAAFIALMTLLPQPGQEELVRATPPTCLVCGPLGGVDVILNVILFLPFGLGLGLLGLPWPAVLAAGLGTSGLVALPLVGPLEAVGKSPGELASAITEALAPEYLRNPRVSVEVLQYRPFFILGEVKAPGSYPYAADVNVRRAAALAGGYTYRAKTGHAYITRVTGGKESRQKASPDTPLLPGDIVEIPERFF